MVRKDFSDWLEMLHGDKFLPFIFVFDFRIDDFRSSPEEGDQAAGAGIASLAGPSWQHHRSVNIPSVSKSLRLFSSVDMCVGLPGMSMPDFDNQTLAALRGRMVRYLMRSREVCLSTEAMLSWHQTAKYHSHRCSHRLHWAGQPRTNQ